MSTDVTIIGGGIAGTSLAVALADQDISASVFERYGGESFSGGILLVSSNAMRVLAELGLAETVLRRGVEVEAMDFRRADGRLLWRLDVDTLAREAGAPSVVIPRAELLAILTERAREVATVQAGAFERYEQHPAGVVAEFADGTEIDAPVLVGADGIRSSVREQLHGPGNETPRTTGQAVWVGSTRFDDPCLPLGRPMAAMGRGLRFWAAALPGGRAYWYALFWERHRPRDLGALRRLYSDFDDWVQDLVFSTRDEDVAKTVVADRRPSRLWGEGRVTLLGDAIHAVTPDLAQGACQAIESSVTLAHCLAHFGLGEQALREYESRRRKRTRRVSQLSYLTCTGSMTDDPVANWLRVLGTRTLLPFIADAQLRWLFAGPTA